MFPSRRALCLLSQLEAVQLIGNCGNGKTTRMLAFISTPNSSYVYLPEDEPCPAFQWEIPSLSMARLPRKESNSCSRQASQSRNPRDLRKHLERYGYCKNDYHRRGEPTEHVQTGLNRRIEASRLGPGPIPKIDTDEASRLHQAHGTDIRSIERELYHQFQNQVIQYTPSVSST